MSENRVVLTLPWPPSVNHYKGRRKGGGEFLTAKAKEFIEVVHIEALSKPRLEGEISVAILAYPPDKRKRDLDNVLKVLLDALESADVFDDDSQVARIVIERQEGCEGTVVVIVEEFKTKEVDHHG